MSQPHKTTISAHRSMWSLQLGEMWQHRELLWLLVLREIKGRYRQTALGPLWVLIQPLVAMVVFSVVFGNLAKIPSDGLPYPIFAYTALIPWLFFSASTNKITTSLVVNLPLISKVYFPRLIVPGAACISGLVDFLMSFVVLVGMMFFYGIIPGAKMLLIPAYLLLAMATALAVGLWLACLAVKFRDVAFAVSYFLQVWMYASPVVYPASLMPEKWRVIYYLNPMAQVIDGFRWALLGAPRPPDISLVITTAVVLIGLVSGAYYFRYTERSIVDMI